MEYPMTCLVQSLRLSVIRAHSARYACWKAGTEVELDDGRKVPRDRDYLARAIQDPDAEGPADYTKGVMAGAMPGRKLTEPEVEALALYLPSLSGEAKP